MPRYIDADKLKERLMFGSELDPEPCKGFRSALLAMVDSQEDADVVEVVRCEECIHHINAPQTMYVWCDIVDGLLPKDWFCADGERGEDDTNKTD